MSTQVRALNDWVLILPDPAPTESGGGISLPPSLTGDVTTGTVRHVGPGNFDRHGNFLHVPVTIGDRVVYAADCILEGEVKIDGEELCAVRAMSLIAVLNQPQPAIANEDAIWEDARQKTPGVAEPQEEEARAA